MFLIHAYVSVKRLD